MTKSKERVAWLALGFLTFRFLYTPAKKVVFVFMFVLAFMAGVFINSFDFSQIANVITK